MNCLIKFSTDGNKKKIEEFTAQLLLYRTNIDRKIAENNFESKLNDLGLLLVGCSNRQF